MIRERLLDQATSIGLRIYQNYYGKWVIRNYKTNAWLLQEHKSGKWVVIFHGTPQAILKPKELLKILEKFNKQFNARKFFSYLFLINKKKPERLANSNSDNVIIIGQDFESSFSIAIAHKSKDH